ncbi:substrate-binding periplasmic protein [Curtanaerobium respiraculi]|uniref:substrate-binding periplasmic protein n=1 Tax=Curtanaerobium respiraculi TaxID=2949669 RepID=UPI0024B34EB6|nr:transporter substrate-binding domain-containing protein [Curtanaerobium respiraculi]
MKRRLMAIAAAAAMCVIAFGLCGCQVLASSSAYSPEKKQATVSSPALGKDGVLRVGVNSSNAPFSTQVSGRLVGIDVDIAAALATEMGLDLELVDVGSDSRGALTDGTVDVVMNMSQSDTSATAWLSDTYIPTAVVLFAQSADAGMPISDSKTTIEAQATSLSSWEATNQFTAATVQSVSDLKTAFSDLESGKVKYVASDAVIGSYVAHTSGSSAVIVGSLQKVGGYSIGLSTSNDQLKTAVSNALDTISSNGVIGVIETKWLGKEIDLSNVALSVAAQKASDSKTTAAGA